MRNLPFSSEDIIADVLADFGNRLAVDGVCQMTAQKTPSARRATPPPIPCAPFPAVHLSQEEKAVVVRLRVA